MYCQACGAQNDENNFRCTACRASLHPSPPGPAIQTADPALAGLIPYKNSCALVGYYLGVFSLIPCVGLLLGPIAVILGVLGLRAVREHPDRKGTIHAWTAIILGACATLGNLVLIGLIAAPFTRHAP